MAAAKSEEAIERAHLVRLYEASCKIEYPKEEELQFRRALMLKLGLGFKLGGLRKRYAFADAGATADPRR